MIILRSSSEALERKKRGFILSVFYSVLTTVCDASTPASLHAAQPGSGTPEGQVSLPQHPVR